MTKPNLSMLPEKDPELHVVVTASRRLGSSLDALIGAVSDTPARPSDLIKSLGINKDLASRVLSAVVASDPLTSAYIMPGPAPLRTMIRKAKRKGAPHATVQEAHDAVDAFERMLTEQVGDKTGLNAYLGAWLPEAREEVSTTARQLVYRGASLIKGLTADVASVSFIVHPSLENPKRCDTVMIGGWVGLKRLLPRVPMRFISRMVHPKHGPQTMFKPGEGDFYARFMEQFSDRPLPATVKQTSDRTEYWLDDRGVGPNSSVRVFVCELYRQNHPIDRESAETVPLRFFYSGIDLPVKSLLLDVFVADSLWPGAHPELRIYETAANGPANPSDSTRDVDVMDTSEVIRPLGTSMDRFRFGRIPDYTAMLESAVSAHGWRGSTFRGYRCQIDYPLYSSQVTMMFKAFA